MCMYIEIIGPDDVDQVVTESEFVENLINQRDAALQEKDAALSRRGVYISLWIPLI